MKKYFLTILLSLILLNFNLAVAEEHLSMPAEEEELAEQDEIDLNAQTIGQEEFLSPEESMADMERKRLEAINSIHIKELGVPNPNLVVTEPIFNHFKVYKIKNTDYEIAEIGNGQKKILVHYNQENKKRIKGIIENLEASKSTSYNSNPTIRIKGAGDAKSEMSKLMEARHTIAIHSKYKPTFNSMGVKTSKATEENVNLHVNGFINSRRGSKNLEFRVKKLVNKKGEEFVLLTHQPTKNVVYEHLFTAKDYKEFKENDQRHVKTLDNAFARQERYKVAMANRKVIEEAKGSAGSVGQEFYRNKLKEEAAKAEEAKIMAAAKASEAAKLAAAKEKKRAAKEAAEANKARMIREGLLDNQGRVPEIAISGERIHKEGLAKAKEGIARSEATDMASKQVALYDPESVGRSVNKGIKAREAAEIGSKRGEIKHSKEIDDQAARKAIKAEHRKIIEKQEAAAKAKWEKEQADKKRQGSVWKEAVLDAENNKYMENKERAKEVARDNKFRDMLVQDKADREKAYQADMNKKSADLAQVIAKRTQNEEQATEDKARNRAEAKGQIKKHRDRIKAEQEGKQLVIIPGESVRDQSTSTARAQMVPQAIVNFEGAKKHEQAVSRKLEEANAAALKAEHDKARSLATEAGRIRDEKARIKAAKEANDQEMQSDKARNRAEAKGQIKKHRDRIKAEQEGKQLVIIPGESVRDQSTSTARAQMVPQAIVNFEGAKKHEQAVSRKLEEANAAALKAEHDKARSLATEAGRIRDEKARIKAAKEANDQEMQSDKARNRAEANGQIKKHRDRIKAEQEGKQLVIIPGESVRDQSTSTARAQMVPQAIVNFEGAKKHEQAVSRKLEEANAAALKAEHDKARSLATEAGRIRDEKARIKAAKEANDQEMQSDKARNRAEANGQIKKHRDRIKAEQEGKQLVIIPGESVRDQSTSTARAQMVPQAIVNFEGAKKHEQAVSRKLEEENAAALKAEHDKARSLATEAGRIRDEKARIKAAKEANDQEMQSDKARNRAEAKGQIKKHRDRIKAEQEGKQIAIIPGEGVRDQSTSTAIAQMVPQAIVNFEGAKKHEQAVSRKLEEANAAALKAEHDKARSLATEAGRIRDEKVAEKARIKAAKEANDQEMQSDKARNRAEAKGQIKKHRDRIKAEQEGKQIAVIPGEGVRDQSTSTARAQMVPQAIVNFEGAKKHEQAVSRKLEEENAAALKAEHDKARSLATEAGRIRDEKRAVKDRVKAAKEANDQEMQSDKARNRAEAKGQIKKHREEQARQAAIKEAARIAGEEHRAAIDKSNKEAFASGSMGAAGQEAMKRYLAEKIKDEETKKLAAEKARIKAAKKANEQEMQSDKARNRAEAKARIKGHKQEQARRALAIKEAEEKAKKKAAKAKKGKGQDEEDDKDKVSKNPNDQNNSSAGNSKKTLINVRKDLFEKCKSPEGKSDANCIRYHEIKRKERLVDLVKKTEVILKGRINKIERVLSAQDQLDKAKHLSTKNKTDIKINNNNFDIKTKSSTNQNYFNGLSM